MDSPPKALFAKHPPTLSKQNDQEKNMHEMRIFGPPGTGKTTKLSKEIIPQLADKYGPNKIMITSFTRAAAEELASRLEISESDIIGTLHSICYRALRFPVLTEQHMDEWNKAHPAFMISSSRKDAGSEFMTKYQVLRNKLIPRESWPQTIIKFAQTWERWKEINYYSDFMDLIEAAGGLFSPPGSPSAIVIDEAQDFSRLEMSTLRRWSTQVSEFWVCGDEDQLLYSFTGASPKNMLEPPLPKEQKIILGQSYRIPASVHKLAEKIIHQVKEREEKEYLPKPEKGMVYRCGETIKDTDWLIKKAQSLTGTTMILASCNYMLNDIVTDLKEQGIVFSNPWKPEDKNWNPLGNKTTQMFLNFMESGPDENYWTTEQLVDWTQHLKVGPTGLIRKKGKAAIKQLMTILDEQPDMQGLHTCKEYIDQILSPDALEPAMNRDITWLKENVVKAKIQPLRYPVQVFKKHGLDALKKPPDLFVGTIHSVKGAGADNVFISPDISYAGQMESFSQEGFENICRLFYVGITRTKQNLFILSPTCREFFEF
jgi:DNA helicase II / ATP-dependent DNA helicase PcrA